MVTLLPLFDEVERIDPEPARPGEDSFSFLNRIDSPYWAKVRTELERWFREFPPADAVDLRARFRSRLPDQHFAAWWELYLFHLFGSLGYEIAVHPDVGSQTHPDFRLVRGEDRFYLEAATVFSGIVEEGRHGERESWILGALNEARSDNFFVGIDFERVGTVRPRKAEIIRPVEEWLGSLDPDQVAAEHREHGGLPSLRLEARDWVIDLEAFPIKAEARGDPQHRLVGVGPMSGGYVNDIEMLEKTLRRKFRHYGPLDLPLVVGVLGASSFLERSDVEQALFGRHAIQCQREPPFAYRSIRQRNGVWMGPIGPTGRGVAAILCASQLHPSTCTRVLPVLWMNPWAESPLQSRLPFATASTNDEGGLTYEEATRSAAEILGLPPEWPGPEEPFK
jgi:hypothetical protein